MESPEDDHIELIDWSGCNWVEQVPGRMSGVPVIIDSRVTPESVIENFDSGDSIGSIAWNYSLSKQKSVAFLSSPVALPKPLREDEGSVR